jgi:hypothetical protein
MVPCLWDEHTLQGLQWAHSPSDNTMEELPTGTLEDMRLSPARDRSAQTDAMGPTLINTTPSTTHNPHTPHKTQENMSGGMVGGYMSEP